MNISITPARIGKYTLGMILLATGLTLTAETGLGTSPLTSIAFVLSIVLHQTFPNMTLVMFCFFILGEVILAQQKSMKTMATLLLQLPLSLIFTQVMHLVQQSIDISTCSVAVRFLFLLLAIILTGVGAAMTIQAELIPNPGDGIVKAIATYTAKPLGTIKNVFDICNVAIAGMLSLLVLKSLVGVGVGSIFAMLGVGRIIALYMKLTLRT